jgi:hypothetical protein
VGLGRSDEARGSPDFAKNRAGDSGARGVKEEGPRESFEERATAFTPALRPAVRLVHASGTRRRKPLRADRGSLVLDAATYRETNATGIGWCRRAAGRKLRSRARIGRSKGVPAYRDRLQKSASGVECPGQARSPLATVRVNGGLARPDIPGDDGQVKRRREPEQRWPSRCTGNVLSRAPERASRGEGPWTTEDTSDRSAAHLVSRGRGKAVSATFEVSSGARASFESRRRRQGCQRCGKAHGPRLGRQRPARSMLRQGAYVRPTKANRTGVNQAIPRTSACE